LINFDGEAFSNTKRGLIAFAIRPLFGTDPNHYPSDEEEVTLI